MKILIITAMDEELEAIRSKYEISPVEEHLDDLKLQRISLSDKLTIYLMKSGIGKVNAGYSTALACSYYHPNYVFNVGVAGGFSESQNILDMVFATHFIYMDVDITSFGIPPGQILGEPSPYYYTDPTLLSIIQKFDQEGKLGAKAFYGLIGSSDKFITNNEEDIKRIRTVFPDVIAVEMEGAAIAHVCSRQKVPLLSLRSLSDVPVHPVNNTQSFQEMLEISAKRAADICYMFIEQLKVQNQ